MNTRGNNMDINQPLSMPAFPTPPLRWVRQQEALDADPSLRYSRARAAEARRLLLQALEVGDECLAVQSRLMLLGAWNAQDKDIRRVMRATK